MKKNYFLVLFSIFVAVGLIAPSVFAENFSHKYKAIYVPEGKVITISLESDPSKGYVWYLVNITNKRVLDLIENEVVPLKEGSKEAGRIGKWSFKTLNTGESIIVFEYRRVSGKDVLQKLEYRVFVR